MHSDNDGMRMRASILVDAPLVDFFHGAQDAQQVPQEQLATAQLDCQPALAPG